MAKQEKQGKTKASLLTKVLILALLAGIGFQLYRLQDQVDAAQAERDALAAQVDAQQQENDALERDIEAGPTEEKMQELARDELDLVSPGDRIFYVNN